MHNYFVSSISEETVRKRFAMTTGVLKMQPIQIRGIVNFCARLAGQGRVPEGVAGKPFSLLPPRGGVFCKGKFDEFRKKS